MRSSVLMRLCACFALVALARNRSMYERRCGDLPLLLDVRRLLQRQRLRALALELGVIAGVVT